MVRRRTHVSYKQDKDRWSLYVLAENEVGLSGQ